MENILRQSIREDGSGYVIYELGKDSYRIELYKDGKVVDTISF